MIVVMIGTSQGPFIFGHDKGIECLAQGKMVPVKTLCKVLRTEPTRILRHTCGYAFGFNEQQAQVPPNCPKCGTPLVVNDKLADGLTIETAPPAVLPIAASLQCSGDIRINTDHVIYADVEIENSPLHKAWMMMSSGEAEIIDKIKFEASGLQLATAGDMARVVDFAEVAKKMKGKK